MHLAQITASNIDGVDSCGILKKVQISGEANFLLVHKITFLIVFENTRVMAHMKGKHPCT